MATQSTPVPAIGGGLPATGAAENRSPARRSANRRDAAAPLSRGLSGISWTELGVPLGVLGVVLAMITPLPPFVLDALIALNITLSLVVLLVGLYIAKPSEFSLFPTTLLLMTLFRLALNVSSSRLILLNGNTGTSAAGHIIEAFGQFVVGGNYIVGAVIFLVLIAIQYVVINHGAVRISEVTARFTLDAMPGKQMSIDSDLNAGLIDEDEARNRRKQLAAEASFYGAMDGASRFTQRDALASVIITAINIIAGFLIGVLDHGMDLRRALETYTVLTIGDGLVTVIPALMISISGGLIVTRASSDSALGKDFRAQVLTNPQPLLLAGGVMLALAFFPGLPALTFLALGGGLGLFGWRKRQAMLAAEKELALKKAPTAQEKENLDALLKVDPLAVEIGLGLVRMVEGGSNSPLLRRIGGIRRQLATDLGYLLPPVRVTDNLSLKAGEYTILLKGVEIARYEIPPGCDLAIASGPGGKAPESGTPAKEPAFGLDAWWIPQTMSEKTRSQGFTVVDPVSVVATHLGEIIRRHAHELFSRQDAKKFLDRVGAESQKLVEDLVPKLLPLSVVQKVLQNLLRERVSIRDGVSILEALSEAAQITKNPVLLTEYVRQALRRVIVQPYLDASGNLTVFFLDPSLEQVIESSIEHGEHASHLNLPPQRMRDLMERLARGLGGGQSAAVLLTSAGARHVVRQLVEPSLPQVAVLSHGEVPAGVKVVSLGMIQ
jgi:flagellar biosynthesis protein FlhA